MAYTIICNECGSKVEVDVKASAQEFKDSTKHNCIKDLVPNSPEPPPIPNKGIPVWELVIEDMKARDNFGRVKYGTPLQTNNGRNALVDAYQEALDLCIYLRQAIEEQNNG